MHIRIFYGFIILTMISGGTAFAQTSIISVETDDVVYEEGDPILISGYISTIIGETQVTLQIFLDGKLIEIAQLQVAKDGNFSHILLAQGPMWQTEGIYVVKVSYGDGHSAETNFNFSSQMDLIETTDNEVVNAGSSGTFDVKYAIKGGEVEKITIDPQNFGLIVRINALNDGIITLDLPREYIDAEKQNGSDEEFIVLIERIDEKGDLGIIQTTYEEQITNSEFRVLTINFEENDLEIQIIGTYVVPEFGTIVMIILTVGILSSILLTRNRLQIKI
jgi:predicted secreted protein with PEFG-CTERM motif